METLKNISVILGLLVSLGTIICITIPNIRIKIGSAFLRKQKVEKDAELLYEIKDLLDEHIAADSAKSEAMKCLLRDSITGIYYKHLKEGELHAYELEDLTHLYDSYKKLGGNSYVENIYKQMTEEWTVTG